MNSDLVGKIVKTLLALLGIWAGVSVTQTANHLGEAAQSYSASMAAGLPKGK